MKKILSRVAVGAGTVAMATVMGVGPASAGNALIYAQKTEWTGNILHFASMNWYANGDSWKVCDLWNDGKKAVGEVMWSDPGGSWRLATEANSTGGTVCKTGSRNVWENEQLTIRIFIGNQEYANSTKVTAS
ncbi:hypothetical protein [Streptomyces sp. NPDC051561]|uniref:hypothetical protein n=1 Tax=Streptomyces sp. NPDC051561 TaxID=3365658 RepID=UPI0037BA847B